MTTTGLPVGWRTVKFGDVVRQVKDRVDPESSGLDRYVAGEHMDSDDLRIRRWGTIGDGYLGPAFHMRFKSGHVLYGSRRTYLRKVALADFDGICANTTFIVEPSTPRLLPGFLPLVMTTEAFHAHSIEQSKGSVNPYINFRDLTWYEFGLPTVDEQKAICSHVHEANRVQWRYELVQDRLSALRSAVAAEAWSETAETAELGRLADVTVGIVVRPAALYVETGGVPALRSLNVFPNRLQEADSVRISEEGHVKHAKSALRGGEVVVVRSGRPGDAAVIPHDDVTRNAIDLLIVRCGPELDPYFLASFLNSASGRSLMLGRSAGTAQQHLNASQLEQVRIPLLSLESQKRLSERFRGIDTLERHVDDTGAAARDLIIRARHRLMSPEVADVQ